MNLHAIAGPAVGIVNPQIDVQWYKSLGYTDVNRKQVPLFAPCVVVKAQVQALTIKDIKQIDNLNLQGTATNTAYLHGNDVQSVVREDRRGGDLFVFGGWEYLVMGILEAWPDWCKVALTRQKRSSATPPLTQAVLT